MFLMANRKYLVLLRILLINFAFIEYQTLCTEDKRVQHCALATACVPDQNDAVSPLYLVDVPKRFLQIILDGLQRQRLLPYLFLNLVGLAIY